MSESESTTEILARMTAMILDLQQDVGRLKQVLEHPTANEQEVPDGQS